MTIIALPLTTLATVILLATGYGLAALRGDLTLTWTSLAAWLGLLVAVNGILALTLWRQRARLSFRAQMLAIVWVSVSVWYWTVAPLLFFLSMNVNESQLTWTAFAFFWEVPVFGGALLSTISLLMLRPLTQYMDGGKPVRRPERVYRWTLWYPVAVGVALFLVSVLGYGIGTLQLRMFTGWPLVEQGKNIVGGAVISLFLAIFLYVVLDTYLGKVRDRLRGDYHLSRVIWRRMNTRIITSTMVLVIGTVGLLGLIAFDALQFVLTQYGTHLPLAAVFNSRLLSGFFASVGLVLVLTVGLIVFVGQALTRAIEGLSRGISEAKKSGVVIQPVRTGDEMEALSQALSDTVGDLSIERNRLRESQIRTDAIFNSMGEGLVVANRAGKVIQVNAQVSRLIGWDTEEMIGQDWGDLVETSDSQGRLLPPEGGPMTMALRTGGPVQKRSYTYTHKDGRTFPVSVTAAALRIGEEVVGAVLLFQDVTREKAVEKARMEFVSLASHQLRTPLTAINWYIELLLRGGSLTGAQQTDLQKMHIRGRRMVRLVNDLLNVSRLDTGRLRVEPVPTNLAELVSSVIEDVQPLAQQRQCVITFHKAEEKFENVAVDRSLMRQVLHNLVANAVVYSPPGQSARVWVQLEQTAQGGYLISVQDNGLGIPYEERSRVFNKFFRADNAVRQETEGTGLGLYIAKKILSASGGKIWFESREGGGTTFFVEIPAEGMRERVGIDLA